jgi:hypothetical protein
MAAGARIREASVDVPTLSSSQDVYRVAATSGLLTRRGTN